MKKITPESINTKVQVNEDDFNYQITEGNIIRAIKAARENGDTEAIIALSEKMADTLLNLDDYLNDKVNAHFRRGGTRRPSDQQYKIIGDVGSVVGHGRASDAYEIGGHLDF